MVKKTKLQKNWDGLRKDLEIQLNKLSKEAKILGRRTENFIHDVSVKGKAATEVLLLKFKREQLYSQLGKITSRSLKGTKKVNSIRKRISILNREIIAKERLAK